MLNVRWAWRTSLGAAKKNFVECMFPVGTVAAVLVDQHTLSIIAWISSPEGLFVLGRDSKVVIIS